MPKRVYTITEADREARRERARKMGKAPKTQKQCENAKKATAVAHKLPRTERQLEACRKNGRKVGLSNHGDIIVKHHRDLCHGEKNPDDIILMTVREHMRFHTTLRNNLRVKDGTHPFLAKNRGNWSMK